MKVDRVESRTEPLQKRVLHEAGGRVVFLLNLSDERSKKVAHGDAFRTRKVGKIADLT